MNIMEERKNNFNLVNLFIYLQIIIIMITEIIIIILYIYVLILANKQLEKYVNFPYYTKIHDHMKQGQKLVHDNCSLYPYLRILRKK